MQYTLAAALLDGAVTLSSFTDERLHRPDMQTLLGKIAVTMTPDITTEYNAGRYVDLEIELADGTIVRERCERPRGSWGAEPISEAEHIVKVRDCLAGSLAPSAIDECIELGSRFEHLDANGVRRMLVARMRGGPHAMLMIDNDIVKRVLTMRECIEAQERAFAGTLTGASVSRPRIDMFVPCNREDGYYRWGSVEGASDGVLAVRLKSDIMTWPEGPDGTRTESKYCMRPGTYCGLVLLFSTQDGEPLAIINDGHLQHMRVGASAGIGARLLAREDAHAVGMIGSGGMARTVLEALVEVRDIKTVKVYSRVAANREAFAAEMTDTLRRGRSSRSRAHARRSAAPTFWRPARTACIR